MLHKDPNSCEDKTGTDGFPQCSIMPELATVHFIFFLCTGKAGVMT
jgi:hypothetical protein